MAYDMLTALWRHLGGKKKEVRRNTTKRTVFKFSAYLATSFPTVSRKFKENVI